MARALLISVILLFVAGCGVKPSRMEHPENQEGRYREQIAVAQHVLEQNEDWADRAEWEVIPAQDGWNVVAWRVEHPQAKGAERYSPAGYSVIQLDNRLTPIHYLPRK